MLTKTLSEAKKKHRNILIKAMNNDIGSIDSAKDSWNPAQISERAKDISYIRSLVDTWNPAQLNEALKMLDLPIIDTWNPAQIEEQRRNLVFYLVERTLTGNPITIKILGNLTPEVTGIKVTMNPIQDLHGYSNPWVGGAGKNKLVYPYAQSTVTDHGITFTDSGNGELVLTNTATETAIFTLSNQSTLANGNYIIRVNTVDGTDSGLRVRVRANSTDTATNYTANTDIPITIENNVLYLVEIRVVANSSPNGCKLYPLVRLSTDTSTTWTPYSNICPISGRTEASVTRTAGEDVETHTHQYSETIYGGVDDFVNGGLVVKKGYKDLGTLTWTKHSDAGMFYSQFSAGDNVKPSTSSTVAGGLICSQYVDSAQSSLSNGKISIDATSIPYINIIDLTKSDLTAAQFKTAMDGVQLCYELATPTTIQTSAEEITLLKGENVLSTDGDSIELKYKQNF